jgi:hypothetical protein
VDDATTSATWRTWSAEIASASTATRDNVDFYDLTAIIKRD